jgi:hypothetical protein
MADSEAVDHMSAENRSANQDALLRELIVEAALACRRADLAYEAMMETYGRYGEPAWDPDVVAESDDAEQALWEAVDDFIEFLG